MSYLSQPYNLCYLTFSGTSGTSTGTNGCTYVSAGTWTVSQYNTIYHIDDTGGNMNITIPDASSLNSGKIMTFVKPRLVQSGNEIVIRTTSNQIISRDPNFCLRNSNDRADLIAHKYGSSGATSYLYRLKMNERVVHETIDVSIGGTQLFTSIKDCIDYCNNYADGPKRIRINPGTYNISEKITIDCAYPLMLESFGTEGTVLSATTAMSATPFFDIKTKADFKGMSFYGLSGLSSIDDQCCLDCGTDNLYGEIHQCYFNGFFKAIELDANSEFWFFDSIIENCVNGVWVHGGSILMSELTINNCTNSIYLNPTGTTNHYAIQNTLFNVLTGQTGVNYIDNTVKPEFHYATGNAFYGEGNYISGLTFTSSTQSDVRYENNAGLRNYKPECWVWVSGNTTATTIANTTNYFKASVLQSSIVVVDMIKFSGGAETQLFTYLPSITRKGTFMISGDLSVVGTNQVCSVALYKNGNVRLQDLDVRCATNAQPYPFSFNAINDMSPNDYFDIRVQNQSSTGAITLRTLMFSITTL